MKRYIKYIYLVWRRGRNDSRIKVGKITRNQTEGVRFEYISEGVKEALGKGFNMYPDFPNPDVVYKNNVLETFAQRLTNTERADIQKYYDYWEILPSLKDNKYYVLAQTQGLLSTDNFEFIAEYFPVKGLNFTSEVCGLTRRQLPSGTLEKGDILEWKLDKKNPYNRYAVQLFKGGVDVGYVKTIHSKVFHDSKYKRFKVTVKSVEQNGHLNRAFIAVTTIDK
ncbi:hypothetical protein [Bacteroides clarus]|uniref:hypothetical protein n=1 Tax=Bacteroides clarus TaxID=626929 RepID=UPI0024908FA2|nr:hypothetical protein [Bacteroides clarus]